MKRLLLITGLIFLSSNVHSSVSSDLFNKFFFPDTPPDCCGTQTKPCYGNHICESEKQYCKELSIPIDFPQVKNPELLNYTLDPVLDVPTGQVAAQPLPSKAITNPINRKGQIALVVGASTGIGKWTAKTLAAAGMKVIGTSRFPTRHPKPNDYTLSDIPLDVTSERSVQNFFNKVIKPLGKIDVLYTGANWEYWGFAKDTTGSDLVKQFNITVGGQQRVITNALPYMRHSNKTRVIIVGSYSAELPVMGNIGYALSKRGLQALNDTYNIEEAILKARGIVPAGPFFSLIEPYFVFTKFGSYEYNIPSTVSKNDHLVQTAKISKFFYDALVANTAITSTPIAIADTVLSIALSQQPSTRYVVANPKAVIIAGGKPIPVIEALSLLHTAPADQTVNLLTGVFNTGIDTINQQREGLFNSICVGRKNSNSTCGNSGLPLTCVKR